VRPEPAAGSRSRTAGAALVLVGLLALAGCGSSSSSSSATTSAAPATTTAASTAATTTTTPATGGSTVSVSADPEGQLKFSTTSLTAKAGQVSVAFTNMSSLEHNLTIASASGTVVGATPTFSGGTKTVSVHLAPGAYKFYCSIPGHRQAGMEGTLTVQ
jgi:plastocyanin